MSNALFSSMVGWMDSSASKEPLELMQQYPALREKLKQRWTNFWTTLYQSVCHVSLEQYNEGARAVDSRVPAIVDTYGQDFAPTWYYSGSGAGRETAQIDENEYLRRRSELGCPTTAPKPRWGYLVAGGAALVAGTVAIVVFAKKGKPKRKRKKRRG